MVLTLEEGKFYLTRDGRKVGPIYRADANGWNTQWKADGDITRWGDHGIHCGCECNDDLVAEWKPIGPVRTVTRKEIVPGIYGKLNVTGTYQKNRVTLDWVTDDFHTAPPIVGLDASELRAAAATLTEIADALEQSTSPETPA